MTNDVLAPPAVRRTRTAVLATLVAVGASLAFLVPASMTNASATPKAASTSFAGTNTGGILDNSNLAISFNVESENLPVTDVRVSITLNHSAIGDVSARLIAPNNTADSPIFVRQGTNGNLGVPGASSDTTDGTSSTYTFADDAPATPTYATAAAALGNNETLAPTTYRASNAGGNVLITPNFAAVNPNGVWTLLINDNAMNGEQGAVSSAVLTINGTTSNNCRAITPTIVGTPGNDNLIGTPGRDVVVLGDGDDVFYGKKGDDLICAGSGNDTIYGNKGDDRVYGESGTDILFGGKGENRCDGGSGTDTFTNCDKKVNAP